MDQLWQYKLTNRLIQYCVLWGTTDPAHCLSFRHQNSNLKTARKIKVQSEMHPGSLHYRIAHDVLTRAPRSKSNK